MGSDFTYADLDGVEIEDYTYKIVKDTDVVDGADCWVIEATPKTKDVNELSAGEIGFIITGIKNLSETKVGDTICDSQKPLKNYSQSCKKTYQT